MEHSKLIALSLKCNKCSRAWSIAEEDFQRSIITCQDPECKSEFSVYEGLKNGLKMESGFIPTPFLANDMFQELIDVKIGYSKIISLPEFIKKVFKINLFQLGAFQVGASDIQNHSFRLMTSLNDDSDISIIGEESKVMIMVHAKTSDYEVPWLHMLAYSLEQFRSEDFVTSILLSEIAFESYLDITIAEGYRKVGLDEDSITRLLKANIPDKVNALMNNVYNIRLSSNKDVFKKWTKDVLTVRNDIAHGRRGTATLEEAKIAYDTVIDAIFHLIEGVDNFRKEQGHPSGLFFRSQ